MQAQLGSPLRERPPGLRAEQPAQGPLAGADHRAELAERARVGRINVQHRGETASTVGRSYRFNRGGKLTERMPV
jgi:hypothetical protein